MALLDEEDNKPFNALYEKYKDRAYAIAYSILEDSFLADDATVEVFISLAKNFKIVKKLNYHKLDYYIVITSRNTAINMLKKEKKHMKMKSYNDDLYLADDNLKAFDYVFLKLCISKLRFNDQQVLYLRYTARLEYKEIAATLGISSAAARKRVQLAKARLKKLIEDGEESL